MAATPEQQAALEIGAHGRTWPQVEADVLAAMCQETTWRRGALARFAPGDFTVARHRAIFQALRWVGDLPVTDDGLAAALGSRPSAARAWRLAAAPSDPAGDIELLALGIECRDG